MKSVSSPGDQVISNRHRRQRASRSSMALPHRQSGVALVVVLLTVFLSMGASMLSSRLSKTELRIAHNSETRYQALVAAEAGVFYAVDQLTENGLGSMSSELATGVGGAMASLGSIVDLDSAGVNYRQGTLTNTSYFVRLDDNFDEAVNNPSLDSDQFVILTSRGRAGTAERIIKAYLEFEQAAMGLYGRDSVTISGGTKVDSYDATKGAYGGTNVGSDARVGSNGAVKLNGSTVEVNGDITTAGTVTGSGVVTGSTTTGAPPKSFPVQLPCGGPYSGSTGISGGSYSGTTTGNLTGKGGGTITLDPGTYCLNSVKLTGSSTLNVNTGPVNIYLTGSLDMTGGQVVNSTGIPSDLNIFSSHTNVKITGGSAASMTIYAPNAEVSISGGSDFFGSVTAADVKLSGGVKYHVDSSLGGSNTVKIANWREVNP